MQKLTMLELEQIHCEQIFKDIKTIPQLQKMTEPPLSYGTIMNAINKGKITACLMETKGNGTGFWLIHLPSARNLWKKRFIAKEIECHNE